MKMKFLIICSPLLLAILALAVANGAKMELVREVNITSDLNTDIRKSILEMAEEMAKNGCLLSRWTAVANFNEPKSKLLIVMECVQWQEGSKHTPTKK